jgi:AraC family transcriptional activator of pobA
VKEKSASSYAEMLNVSSHHLTRTVKEMVEKNTSDLIAEPVILEAKRVLIHAAQSYAEIAYAMGCEDYSYFTRLFKKRTGEIPSAFQDRYRQNVK